MARRTRKRSKSKKPNTSKPEPGSTRELLGVRVRELRLRAEMTQRQLSQVSNVSGVFLGVIERGEKSVGLETLERVSTALGVSLSDLFTFEKRGPDTRRNQPSPADALAQRIASLARGASLDSLSRLERIAEIVLATEGQRTHRRPRKGTPPVRRGRERGK